jgi:hypothetical protein
MVGQAGSAPATEQDDDWPDWVDEQDALRSRIAAVNEGDLAFLDGSVASDVHHHASRVVISEGSLVDGWVLLEQCHERIDQVSAAQILFKPETSRAISVRSFRNIEWAYAEGNTVQLRGISSGSRVCISSESRALQIEDGEVFELRNGPFMRRFLDGYYPLRLTMQIDFPKELALADYLPQPQPGFLVTEQPGRIDVEALFEGQLLTRFRFLRR